MAVSNPVPLVDLEPDETTPKELEQVEVLRKAILEAMDVKEAPADVHHFFQR